MFSVVTFGNDRKSFQNLSPRWGRAAVFIVKTFSREFWVPMGVGFDHGVEDDQEFSHAGHEDDFGEFALNCQAICERTNHRVVPTGRQGGHVQRASDRATTTVNRSTTSKLSAVPVVRCDTDECGDFLPIELAEFGNFRNQGCGGDCADAWRALEKFVLALPLIIRFDKLGDFRINPADILRKAVNILLHVLANEPGRCGCLTVHFGGSQRNQLSASRDQFVEFVLFFMGLRHGSRSNHLSEMRDDACVDFVGLGEDAECFGEVADLPRIDDGDEVSGIDEFQHNAFLVPAGRFEHDEARFGFGQGFEYQPVAGIIVAKATDKRLGPIGDIEFLLRDINSNHAFEFHMRSIPSLQIRARRSCCASALAAVRACLKRPTTIQLSNGLGVAGSEGHRSVVGRRCCDCLATLGSHNNGISILAGGLAI